MKRFNLVRKTDVTGISGTGLIAWGCEFPNGKVALHWATETAAMTWYMSIEDVIKIHGHEGATIIEWIDENV